MKRDVFISYSRRNMERVMEIKRQIDAQCGTECWIDLQGIESGSEMFLRDIVGGIDACKVFLFMLSRESMESEYALLELNYAKEQKKKVVLVNIDDCRMTGVFLFKYSLTDTIAWNNNPQREKLLRDVRSWVGGGQKEEPKPEIPPAVPQPDYSLKEIEERIARLDKEVGVLKPFKDSYGKFGFKDNSGKVLIPCQWNHAWRFENGLAAVKDNTDKWGYIDKTGRVVIPCRWYYAKDFHGSFAGVKDSTGKWGFIDKSGKVVIPCKWNDVDFISGDHANVKNSNGEWIWITIDEAVNWV